MVDPKVIDLQSFDRIPHILLPVVTDTRQAANAPKCAVDEMERRYQLLANAGTKNTKTYNAWVKRVHQGEVRGFELPKPTVVTSEDGSVVEFGAEKEPPKLPEKLPYIVIVVDEFADLMMQQGKEVEASIARLAQKARAAGMHVILATQRPSVDVITGMIKANFPSRIAFKVTQRNDSRTILDEQGAEHLLCRGDMLVKLNGSNETRRVQCPFVSEEEVERVTSFLRQQGEPTYDDSILLPRGESGKFRISEIVGGFTGTALHLKGLVIEDIGEALWRGKVFFRDERVLRNRIEDLSILKKMGLVEGEPKKMSYGGKETWLLFPAKLYCGQSLLDARRESIIIDYFFTDEIPGYQESPDYLAGRRGLKVRDEIRMIRPGFYLGLSLIHISEPTRPY